MNSFKQKIATWIIPAFMLGMVSFLPGCSMSRQSGNVQKITATRDGMLYGTLDLSSGANAEGAILVEKIMPSKVTVGKPFEYVLHVTNRTDCHFSDVVVSEKFPEKYEMLKASLEPAKVSGRTAEWTVGELGPKETKIFTVRGTAQEISRMLVCTKVTYVPMLCLGPEATVSGLKLTLEASGQTMLCDGIAEKIKIENTGTDLMEDIKISQALPEGLTTAEGKNLLEIRAGKLAGNETKTFDARLKAQKAGTYIHKIKALASNGLSISAPSVATVVVQPVLKITMDGPKKVFINQNADFKVTIENTGNANSTSTVVTAKIPASMKFVSASNGGSLSGDNVAWALGVLATQKTVSLSMTFKNIMSGSAQLTATVRGDCCQEAATAAKIDVQGIPAILLEANDTEDPVQVGGMEKFRVVVTNQGSAPDTHIVLKINFEKNFDYVSSSGPTQAKAESAKTIEFAPLASLAPGQKATWEILAKATEEGDHRASFHVKSDALGRSVEKVESTRVY
ncbi:MAG: hypothetical protein WC530_10080 [Candidatus Omnitrophota bacterium]|jgi:uncharacterized repeat protein (TIGR01451 family)